MKLNWCKLAIMALALGVFTACSEDDEPNGEGPGTETGGGDDTTGGSGDNTGGEPVVSLGAYVLNTGNWGGNDAGIQFLDFQTGELSEDLYAAANGEGLGDLASSRINQAVSMQCPGLMVRPLIESINSPSGPTISSNALNSGCMK